MVDRIIQKSVWSPGRIGLIALGLVLALVAVLLWQRSSTSRLTVDPARLTLSQVGIGEFREYFPFDGTVVPQISVYLDVEGGGRVEEIFTEHFANAKGEHS